MLDFDLDKMLFTIPAEKHDEKEIADLLDLYLANEGYTIHKCYDGESALKIVETQAWIWATTTPMRRFR